MSAFVSICTITTSTALSHTYAYPVTNPTASLTAICVITLAFVAHLRVVSLDLRLFNSNPSGRPTTRSWIERLAPGWVQLVLLVFILGRCLLWTTQNGNTVEYHPIDQLIQNAKLDHDLYRRRAFSSRSVDDAAETYLKRYRMYAPPAFNRW